MSRIRRLLPRPALVVAIMALVLATAGTAFAIGEFGVGKLREGARQKVVGVGKLVHVSQTTDVPVTTAQDSTTTVKATCPGAPVGDLQPISGGGSSRSRTPSSGCSIPMRSPMAGRRRSTTTRPRITRRSSSSPAPGPSP